MIGRAAPDGQHQVGDDDGDADTDHGLADILAFDVFGETWSMYFDGSDENSGIYKSIDGGKNWSLMGLEKTRNIHRIIIDKDNPNTVYVAAIGSPWGAHNERGIYKTIDGGKTWKNILFVNNKTGAADLVMDAQNPNKLIAAMWEHSRKPYTFNSGGEGSGLYISFDGGENWTKQTKGLPKDVELGRIGLAISPVNPDFVFAIIISPLVSLSSLCTIPDLKSSELEIGNWKLLTITLNFLIKIKIFI